MKRVKFITLLWWDLAAAPAWSADLSESWTAAVETSAGSGSPEFVFKQDGEKLTGTYSGALGSADLTGTVKDAAVAFSFTVDAGGESVKVEYKGKLDASAKTMNLNPADGISQTSSRGGLVEREAPEIVEDPSQDRVPKRQPR
ncbi:MAG: hypothetical protein FJW31_17175 [Acidobacteria bacterium]|nr:hypothetical protein [Acidobacteriota bacterium]